MKRQSTGTSSSLGNCTENSLNIVDRKRTKLNDFKSEGEQTNFPASKDKQPNSSQDESSRGKALGNAVILEKIFKHFSTTFLISSCSLVNRNWNRDARIFIRNKRKCAASHPNEYSVSTCQLLHDFRNFCALVRDAGRELPFNGLKIELLPTSQGCPKDSGCEGDVHVVHLPRDMNLKHLDINCWFDRAEDLFKDPSADLIRDHAGEIQDLKVHSVLFLKFLLDDDQPPTFPHLKEIAITGTDSYGKTVQKSILQSLHARSPNLRSIFVAGSGSLETVPEECYGLVGNLEFFTDDILEDGLLLRQIVDREPRLRQLRIYESFEDDDGNKEAMCNFLTPLLQSCHDSLEDFTLHADGLYVLPLLSKNALKNLSTFRLDTHDEDTVDQLWDLLASIEGDNMMPQLEELTLELNCSGPTREWPPNNPGEHVHHTFSGVRKLTLELTCLTPNLMEIKATFPNVTSLELILCRSEFVPSGEFWELWPNLEELKVSGTQVTLRKNHDAELCGIHEQEAELLREMDNEYLSTVQIVPIRPSLLTMQNLHTLSMDVKFCPAVDANSSENSLAFISNVTELIVLKRMLQGDATIYWVLQSKTDEDSVYEDDIDDGEGEEGVLEDDSEDEYDGLEENENENVDE